MKRRRKILSTIFFSVCDISFESTKMLFFVASNRKRLVVLLQDLYTEINDILSCCFSLNLFLVVSFACVCVFYIHCWFLWFDWVVCFHWLHIITINFFSILIKSIFGIVAPFHKLVLLVISLISSILSLFSVTFFLFKCFRLNHLFFCVCCCCFYSCSGCDWLYSLNPFGLNDNSLLFRILFHSKSYLFCIWWSICWFLCFLFILFRFLCILFVCVFFFNNLCVDFLFCFLNEILFMYVYVCLCLFVCVFFFCCSWWLICDFIFCCCFVLQQLIYKSTHKVFFFCFCFFSGDFLFICLTKS